MLNYVKGLAEIRTKRQEELSASDWTQLPDVKLTAEQKEAWAEYRQALRDVTNQESYPDVVIFPTPPQE